MLYSFHCEQWSNWMCTICGSHSCPHSVSQRSTDGFWKSVARYVPRDPVDMRILNPYFIQEASFKLIGLPHNNGQMGRGVRDLLTATFLSALGLRSSSNSVSRFTRGRRANGRDRSLWLPTPLSVCLHYWSLCEHTADASGPRTVWKQHVTIRLL